MSGVRDEVLALAKGWLGTPYRHQASCKGAGTDCLGLLRGLWRELYGAEPEVVPAYSADLGVVSEVGETPAFIHAYSGQGVVSSPLSDPWKRRIVARFQFPERTV